MLSDPVPAKARLIGDRAEAEAGEGVGGGLVRPNGNEIEDGKGRNGHLRRTRPSSRLFLIGSVLDRTPALTALLA